MSTYKIEYNLDWANHASQLERPSVESMSFGSPYDQNESVLASKNCRQNKVIDRSHHVQKKSQICRIKTLFSGDIILPGSISTVDQVKQSLQEEKSINPKHLMFIRNGKEIFDDAEISDGSGSSTYLLLKTSAVGKVVLDFKDYGSKVTTSAEFDLGSKIFHLKKQLFSKKLTSLRPHMQRLICGTHIMKDNNRLGDYLLNLNLKFNNKISNPSTSTSKLGRSVVFISKSFDGSQEIDVEISFPRKSLPKFGVGLCTPISNIKTLVHRLHGMPFSMPFSLRYNQVVLNPNKCLLDYGVSPRTKSLTLHALDCSDVEHSLLLCHAQSHGKDLSKLDIYDYLSEMGSSPLLFDDCTFPLIPSYTDPSQLHPIPFVATRPILSTLELSSSAPSSGHHISPSSSLVMMAATPKPMETPSESNTEGSKLATTSSVVRKPVAATSPSSSKSVRGGFSGLKRGFLDGHRAGAAARDMTKVTMNAHTDHQNRSKDEDNVKCAVNTNHSVLGDKNKENCL